MAQICVERNLTIHTGGEYLTIAVEEVELRIWTAGVSVRPNG